jgi:very-short-patch-repair endonuclease
LQATQGRFELNVRLPIAFDGQSQIEADLLCAESRVVIELDGAPHLADAASYRRDRRKDLLLQENGYRILRFLAEDVGKELATVLDTILRSLAHSRRPLS